MDGWRPREGRDPVVGIGSSVVACSLLDEVLKDLLGDVVIGVEAIDEPLKIKRIRRILLIDAVHDFVKQGFKLENKLAFKVTADRATHMAVVTLG